MNKNNPHTTHPLFLHINRFTDIREDDFEEILGAFQTLKVKKKEHLMLADTLCDKQFFVLNGCLNMYFIDANGSKQTLQFAIENWWITDYLAFGNEQKTEFFIQSVEPATILSIDFSSQEQLLERFPKLEKYFRKVLQIAYGASLMRVKYQFELSKEEIYLHFTRNFPDFEQRVPQYLIASYLGLTPEYVSEIRRKQLS
ncbi:Crp/Fnr family transcriptional regulator [Echinicola marina]|uniref:Crp/Fnr family transcriptional regulator n=1 Tax=Echinicola marina TaxID=2859768 RepID=UPI001CF6287E|nr:Crp/Fnr family transcriptional regulator [Echinicola marina]UCS92561.1 Crp/Fnr family transcriptional regulator [Echinicola marina]